VRHKVEGVTDWAFDERDEMFSHDGFLEIIDWTGNETAGKHHACTARQNGEQVPQII